MCLRTGASTLIFDFLLQFLFHFRSRNQRCPRRERQRNHIFDVARMRKQVEWLDQSDIVACLHKLLQITRLRGRIARHINDALRTELH